MTSEELLAELRMLKTENAALQDLIASRSADSKNVKTEVCKVSVKLPPFWPDSAVVWFSQAEAQFHLAGITSDMTMYSHVLGQIDQKLAREIEDIVVKPPATGKYALLKDTLIKRLSSSEEQRVRRLLSIEELGDKSPSQFLRHLRSLAGTTLNDDNILRQLWLRRLPSNVQAILAAQADLSLEKLSELADKIMEVSPGTSSVFAVSNTPTIASDSTLNVILSRLDGLDKQVAALSTKPQHLSRARSISRNRNFSRAPTPGNGPKRCWYHKKFGTKATKCVAPCSWNSENPRSNQ